MRILLFRLPLCISAVLVLFVSTALASVVELPLTEESPCHYGDSGAFISCGGVPKDESNYELSSDLTPRFTVNGNGSVTDNLSGVVWLLKAGGCVPSYYSTFWQKRDWVRYTLASGLCGLTDGSVAGDWRLPYLEELQSVVDLAYYNPAVSNTAGTGQWVTGDPFTGVSSSWYWTDDYNSFFGDAWAVNMMDGSQDKLSVRNYYGSFWPIRRYRRCLNVSKVGAGAGTITSNPAGINCDEVNMNCASCFDMDQSASLSVIAVADGSIFTGWSGNPDCTDGLVSMNAEKSCTANFDRCNPALAASISDNLYGSVALAYSSAALPPSADLIKIISSNQQEVLDFHDGKKVTLSGGYDCSFTEPPVSYTTVTGSLTIESGEVTISRVIFQ